MRSPPPPRGRGIFQYIDPCCTERYHRLFLREINVGFTRVRTHFLPIC
jgi:hypothetical protein